MQNKIQSLLFSLPLALFTATPASAINIVTYNLLGATGSQATQASASSATNITSLDITRSVELNANGGLGSFASNGFEGTVAAPTSNEYVQLGFTVNPGFTVSLNNLKIGTRSSATGPGTMRLFYSLDDFVSATSVGSTITQPSTLATVLSTIDLSSLTGLTNTVTFRFYEDGNTQADTIGATDINGTFRLSNFDTNGIVFDGTVATAVPFEFAPEFGLVAVGAWVSRKWIVKKIQEFKK